MELVLKFSIMARNYISLWLTWCLAISMPLTSVAFGTTEHSKTRDWASPKEIHALSYAISLAEMPMALSKINSDVLGDFKSSDIFGFGNAKGAYLYRAITDPSSETPYYGVELKHGERKNGDTEILSIKLYYCNTQNMKFYDLGGYLTAQPQLIENFRAFMKKTNETPWQMGVFITTGMIGNEHLEYITKDNPNKTGLVDKKYPIPFIDARIDSVLYPQVAKVPEPKKVAEHEVLYPLELKRSAISGKVTLYVRINETGCPIRIAVKESTQDVFERYAIAHALQTTWESNPKNNGVQAEWFESEVIFDMTK